MGTDPVREGPSKVFQVLVVDEIGGVEADPGADALDDNGADVGRHISEAVRAHSLEQPCRRQLSFAFCTLSQSSCQIAPLPAT